MNIRGPVCTGLVIVNGYIMSRKQKSYSALIKKEPARGGKVDFIEGWFVKRASGGVKMQARLAQIDPGSF